MSEYIEWNSFPRVAGDAVLCKCCFFDDDMYATELLGAKKT